MPSESRLAAAVLLIAALAAVGAPLLANDRPLLARLDGRLVAPAFADLPIVGRWIEASGGRSIDWSSPPADGRVRVIRMPPIPYSFRGVRLDESLRPPSRQHWLGTDILGRDLLARMVYGASLSLLIGFMATALSLLAGFLLGAAAGSRGGLLDAVIVRLIDVFACFPPFVLALAFVAALGRGGLGPTIAAIALSRWTGMARYVRGEVLRQRGGEIWVSARAAGAGGGRLIVKHLLPLLMGPLAVMAAFGIANAVMLEGGLSFLGFGVEPPAPSWGALLAESRASLDAAWWPVVFPVLALVVVLAALCALAEGIAAGEDRRAPG